MKWEEVRQFHADAAARLAATAETLPAEKWLVPRAEGKWTPAEVVEHLNLVYDTLLRELAGGGGMAVRTSWWQRLILRATIVPRLLRGAPFPKGARAPRETRPARANPDQRSAVSGFRDRAERFDAAAADLVQRGARGRITHAYFGSASVPDGVLLCARHIRHHHQQLMESA